MHFLSPAHSQQQSSPMPPKPASIVLESPSSSFDISQMNLEDFTSQRLEEMEEREEDIGFAGEKIDSREEEGMLIEARSETGAREDQESSSTAWQEQEESHNEVPVGGTRSLPVGAGGGKKMPSSDKILQEGKCTDPIFSHKVVEEVVAYFKDLAVMTQEKKYMIHLSTKCFAVFCITRSRNQANCEECIYVWDFHASILNIMY